MLINNFHYKYVDLQLLIELPVIHFLDHEKKTFQEIFPNMPSWSLYEFVSQYCNASSIISFDLNLKEIQIKKRSRKLFSKAKTVQLNSRSVKAEVYKLTNIVLNTQERLNEKFIGDRPSFIIKTKIIHKKKIQKNAGSSSTSDLGSMTSLSASASTSRLASSESSLDSDIGESDEEGYESSFSMEEVNSNSNINNQGNNKDKEKQTSQISIIEMLNTDKGPLNKKTKEQITHMLITGKDENDNPLQKKDIEFLNDHIEQYLEDIDNESIDTVPLETPKTLGPTPSIISLKSASTNTLLETKSIDSFNTGKFVSHSTIMANNKSSSSSKAHTEKYNNNSSTLSSIVNSNPNIERIREVVSESQVNLWEKQDMIFQEYISNKAGKGPLHMGRKLNVEYDQHVYKQKVKFFMCKCDKDYPISLSQFAPLIEYLLYFTVNNQEEKLNIKSYIDNLINELSGKDHFPGKIGKLN